ncbi:hypothetical protein [Frankia sp. KB5]|uniref:hypothetical protein n=1 Tax=Frankia sp. KB5 TaxID=683318 RepID=UPI001055D6C4|nr:hypothetical protein [Frankia sp. KB5]
MFMPPFFEVAPHRGGLLDLAPRSVAPSDLIGRLLDEADRVGLTDEQIRMLLRVQRDYRAALHALDVEMALAAHEVRLTPEALAPQRQEERRVVFQRRGELFAHREIVADEAIVTVFELLTDAQAAALMAVYGEEVTATLTALAPMLVAALGPRYTLMADDGDGPREVAPDGLIPTAVPRSFTDDVQAARHLPVLR